MDNQDLDIPQLPPKLREVDKRNMVKEWIDSNPLISDCGGSSFSTVAESVEATSNSNLDLTNNGNTAGNAATSHNHHQQPYSSYNNKKSGGSQLHNGNHHHHSAGGGGNGNGYYHHGNNNNNLRGGDHHHAGGGGPTGQADSPDRMGMGGGGGGGPGMGGESRHDEQNGGGGAAPRFFTQKETRWLVSLFRESLARDSCPSMAKVRAVISSYEASRPTPWTRDPISVRAKLKRLLTDQQWRQFL